MQSIVHRANIQERERCPPAPCPLVRLFLILPSRFGQFLRARNVTLSSDELLFIVWMFSHCVTRTDHADAALSRQTQEAFGAYLASVLPRFVQAAQVWC